MELKEDVQRIYKLITGSKIETEYEVKEELKENFNYEYLLEFLHQDLTEKNKRMINKIQSFKTADDFQDFLVFLHYKSLIQAF